MSFCSLVRNCCTNKGGIPWMPLSGFIIAIAHVLWYGLHMEHCLVYCLIAFERVHSVTLMFLRLAKCKADKSIMPYLFPVILVVEYCVV
jgi:hypothetical protein